MSTTLLVFGGAALAWALFKFLGSGTVSTEPQTPREPAWGTPLQWTPEATEVKRWCPAPFLPDPLKLDEEFPLESLELDEEFPLESLCELMSGAAWVYAAEIAQGPVGDFLARQDVPRLMVHMHSLCAMCFTFDVIGHAKLGATELRMALSNHVVASIASNLEQLDEPYGEAFVALYQEVVPAYANVIRQYRGIMWVGHAVADVMGVSGRLERTAVGFAMENLLKQYWRDTHRVFDAVDEQNARISRQPDDTPTG